MGKVLKLVLFFLIASVGSVFSSDEIDSLIDDYKHESKLSKITKRESAGFLELYTRDELEKMQAHNLLDVFKIIPGLILTKDRFAINQFSQMKLSVIRESSVRLYVNDHEMTSASFGSSFLIWGDMPIEYIDHIEVYKATSSIEFGNEVASLIIRVYTKKANREEGGKIRMMLSDNGGYDTNIYYAHSIDSELSYFVYGNKDNLKRDVDKNYYGFKSYDIESSKESYTLFANINYKGWMCDIGTYDKSSDAYLGPGIYKTPSGDGIDSRHSYIHISKTFSNDFKLQLSYDNIQSDIVFRDENGILISDPISPGNGTLPSGVWAVNDSDIVLKDQIVSVVLEQRYNVANHSLLFGGFYKYKRFKDSAVLKGMYDYSALPFYYRNYSIENALNLTSLYFEDSYDYDESLKFVLSLKGDFYRYEKGVKNRDKAIGRFAIIKNMQNFQFKGYATYSYIPATFVELYNDYDTPAKVKSDLEYPQQIVYSFSVRYKDKKQSLEMIVIDSTLKKNIYYNLVYGYQNTRKKTNMVGVEFRYEYNFDKNNKLNIDYSVGTNNRNIDINPRYTANIRFFNKYKKFDFYNALSVKDAYSCAGIDVKRSYDYSASIKYHISDDVSFGLKGDNIFNSGYKDVYPGYYKAISITQQRFWANVEVVF